MLSKHLIGMDNDVIDLYSNELSFDIVEDGVAEALSTIRKVIFYRYYHVFKKGELEALVEAEKQSKLSIISSAYDSANWCLLLRKLE